ncbi:MAG: cobalamin biosynthesis protein CbiG [Oscillospiraceae bacterium]|nr:cobalamin biosynthesis protein CbiG [Oscillospiraceae bacterium]
MEIRMISFTRKGYALGETLAALLSASHCVTLSKGFGADKTSLSGWTAEAFAEAEGLIFIGAAGIAVRSIAPHLASKISDPGVLVVDDCGRFVIPILSGHLGGANELAAAVAELLQAIPVITTATDSNGVFAVDSWARRQGLMIANPERIKWVSARLLAGETIRIRSQFPISGTPPRGIELTDDKEYDVLVSIKTRGREGVLRLIPPVCALGVGCRRDIPAEAVETAFQALLGKGSIAQQAVCRVCSINMKAGEPGILAFCRARRLPFECFSAQTLAQAEGSFASSAFVRQVTGVDNVCERSAVCGCPGGGDLIVKKNAGNGVTMALAMPRVILSF